MMKRSTIFLVLAFLSVTGMTFFPQIAQAEIEWRIIKGLDIKDTPLDIAPSTDGQWLFILTPGKILVYSFQEGKIIDQVAIDKDFDRIASLPRPNMLTIASSMKKTLQVILLEFVHKIDVTGLPFKGPSDASVTVAVFTDYQ
jgi:hypothetical protein